MQAQRMRPRRCWHDWRTWSPSARDRGRRACARATAARGRARHRLRGRRGEVFGLLGPNGAGKTTTVEILEGYRARSGRRACRVLGHDPAERARAPARARSGSCCRAPASTATSACARRSRTWPALYPRAARRRRGARARRARGAARAAAAHALGRPAAAARPRARARRRPRARVPRRADHRLRPRGAARRVGTDPHAARRSARPCC